LCVKGIIHIFFILLYHVTNDDVTTRHSDYPIITQIDTLLSKTDTQESKLKHKPHQFVVRREKNNHAMHVQIGGTTGGIPIKT